MTFQTDSLNEGFVRLRSREVGEARLRAQLEEQAQALEKLLQEHGQLDGRYRRLQKELERAGRVQQSLLPQRLDALDGYRLSALYRPCEAVGGDFYDVVHCERTAVVLVSDVVGHGLEAALTTMLIKAVFHEAVRPERSPAELLGEMNAKLYRVLPTEMFAVAAAVKLHAGVPRAEIANAGLPYPFVLRSSRRRVEELGLPGFPLGLFENVTHERHEVSFEAGDVLLLSTDGIRSICGADGEPFEADALKRALEALVGESGGTVVDSLMAHALAFGEGRPLSDDVNLVAVTRRRAT